MLLVAVWVRRLESGRSWAGVWPGPKGALQTTKVLLISLTLQIAQRTVDPKPFKVDYHRPAISEAIQTSSLRLFFLKSRL